MGRGDGAGRGGGGRGGVPSTAGGSQPEDTTQLLPRSTNPRASKDRERPLTHTIDDHARVHMEMQPTDLWLVEGHDHGLAMHLHPSSAHCHLQVHPAVGVVTPLGEGCIGH